MNTSNIHVFRYQPTLADTVIYWSLTFVLFFLSMIGLMEQQGRINLFSAIMFLIFLFFTYIGIRRKIILTPEEVKVYAVLKKNNHDVNVSEIEHVSVGSHGVTLNTSKDSYTYLMLRSSKEKMIHLLHLSPYFSGEINGQKKGVD